MAARPSRLASSMRRWFQTICSCKSLFPDKGGDAGDSESSSEHNVFNFFGDDQCVDTGQNFCCDELVETAPVMAAVTDRDSQLGSLALKAPFLAAVPVSTPSKGSDVHHSLADAPKARRFKKRGCRAGKARNAVADCSSLHEEN